MDETRISITVRPIYLERLLYWIIIVVLLVLLILAWMKDGSSATDAKSAQGAQVAAPTQPSAPAQTAPASAPAAPSATNGTCDDVIKNQDETSIDCGGSCPKCSAGSACKVNADCIGGYCVNNLCTSTAPVVLSNKLTVSINNVGIITSDAGKKKVSTIDYAIVNGLSDDFSGLSAKVYVRKTGSTTNCYNQQTAQTCDDSYAEFTIDSPVRSGKNYSNTIDLKSYYTSKMGNYVVDPVNTGSTVSEFQVVMFLYDNVGNQINNAPVSTAYLVK